MGHASVERWCRFMLLAVILLGGCATAHQIPGVDKEKMVVYGHQKSKNALPRPDSTFAVTLDEAITALTHTCYDLDVPLFLPLTSIDAKKARLTSGVFAAQCDVDCKCGGSSAIGHGSHEAAAVLVVDLSESSVEDHPVVLAKISTMFWRTESTSGEAGSTDNLYFDSLGRIEEKLIAALKACQPGPH